MERVYSPGGGGGGGGLLVNSVPMWNKGPQNLP